MNQANNPTSDPKSMSDDDWRQKLTPEQYRVLRGRGTETPGSGALLHNDASGEYTCAGCGTVLFQSDSKYETNVPGLIGWPSFADVAHLGDKDSPVELHEDTSMWMRRVEVLCKTCGGHLGHLFPDDTSPTGQHYCINSASLGFKQAD